MTYKAQAALFLVQMKKLVKEGRYVFIPRDKNIAALAKLGWRETDLVDFLWGLTSENYSSGPEEDLDYPSEEVWIFGDEIDGTEYYIKLKIRLETETVVCISFHAAKEPLQYPFRRRDP